MMKAVATRSLLQQLALFLGISKANGIYEYKDICESIGSMKEKEQRKYEDQRPLPSLILSSKTSSSGIYSDNEENRHFDNYDVDSACMEG